MNTEENIILTPAAAEYFKKAIGSQANRVGIQIAVKNAGCSGHSYVVDFATKITSDDLVFESHEVKVITKPEYMVYLKGMSIDWVTKGLNSQIKFINPNAQNECGCGESFSVD